MDFFPCRLDQLRFDLLGDYNYAIDISEHQIAGGKTDATDFDGDVEVDSALAMFAVINACCSCEDGKPHCPHLAHIADGTVNDSASASPIHRSSREQLSPDAGAHRALGGSDQDVVGLATVDSQQFLFIRAIVLVGHFAPQGRFATSHQHL